MTLLIKWRIRLLSRRIDRLIDRCDRLKLRRARRELRAKTLEVALFGIVAGGFSYIAIAGISV